MAEFERETVVDQSQYVITSMATAIDRLYRGCFGVEHMKRVATDID